MTKGSGGCKSSTSTGRAPRSHLPAELVEAQGPPQHAADGALVKGVRVQEERPAQAGARAPGSRLQHAPEPGRLREHSPQSPKQLLNLRIPLP